MSVIIVSLDFTTIAGYLAHDSYLDDAGDDGRGNVRGAGLRYMVMEYIRCAIGDLLGNTIAEHDDWLLPTDQDPLEYFYECYGDTVHDNLTGYSSYNVVTDRIVGPRRVNMQPPTDTLYDDEFTDLDNILDIVTMMFGNVYEALAGKRVLDSEVVLSSGRMGALKFTVAD